MKEKTNRKQDKKVAIFVWAVICIIVIGVIVLPFLGEVIWYDVTVDKYQEELYSYSPEVYEYLLEAINNIFKEDECVIDINAIPKDIIMEKFEMKDDRFVCVLRWDNEKNGKYIPIASMTVDISNNFEIMSITSAYSSEENFVKAFKENIKADLGNVRTAIWGVELIIYILGAVIWARYDDITIKCKKLFHSKK